MTGADFNTAARAPQQPEQDLLTEIRNGARDRKKVLDLVTKEESLNKKDYYGRTALMWAARKGRLNVIRALLDHGAALDESDNAGGQP